MTFRVWVTVTFPGVYELKKDGLHDAIEISRKFEFLIELSSVIILSPNGTGFYLFAEGELSFAIIVDKMLRSK